MLHICRQLGFPIAEGETEVPATILVFLGILLDTVKLEMRLPEDKLAALKALLQQWRTTKKTTKRELLSLIGSLSFTAKVIPAGRLFLRRLIDLSTSVPKLHHRIKLNASAHLPGIKNTIADALSRQQVQCFRNLVPEAEASPVPTPAWLTKL